jgi:hypothetical protein
MMLLFLMFFRLFDYISGQNEDSKLKFVVISNLMILVVAAVNVVAINVLQTLRLHQRTERRQ